MKSSCCLGKLNDDHNGSITPLQWLPLEALFLHKDTYTNKSIQTWKKILVTAWPLVSGLWKYVLSRYDRHPCYSMAGLSSCLLSLNSG